MQNIVRAPASVHLQARPGRMIRENEILPDDDPLVVEFPQFFTDDLEPLFNRTGPPVTSKKSRTTATQDLVEAR